MWAVAILGLLFSLFVAVAPTRRPVEAAPSFVTLSFYMGGMTDSSAVHRGCSLGGVAASTPGQQEFVPFLHYGGPRMSGSSARVSSWSFPDYSMSEVQSRTFAFAQGFFYCAAAGGDVTSKLSMVVGTSNDASGVSSPSNHGAQWGNMVNALHSQLKSQSWGSRTGAFGGINVEPGFSWNPTNSKFWINNVRNKVPRTFVSNPTAFCPTSGTYSSGTNCGSGWTAEDVASVSYFNVHPVIQPFPQIYSSSYVERWYRLSKYSAGTSRGKFQFRGVMTQWRACQQVGCGYSTYWSSTGFNNLQNKINSDSATAFTIPPAMLDIRWADGSNYGATP